jgi:hypothetical protein
MWMPQRVVDWLNISLDSVKSLREENAVLKAKLDIFQSELTSSKINLDWLRIQYNQVQMERAELMNKVYGIKTPVPELKKDRVRPPSIEEFNFDDIGDEVAAKLGLPHYGIPTAN